MKKIKLLSPILTTVTILPTILPIVACNKTEDTHAWVSDTHSKSAEANDNNVARYYIALDRQDYNPKDLTVRIICSETTKLIETHSVSNGILLVDVKFNDTVSSESTYKFSIEIVYSDWDTTIDGFSIKVLPPNISVADWEKACDYFSTRTKDRNFTEKIKNIYATFDIAAKGFEEKERSFKLNGDLSYSHYILKDSNHDGLYKGYHTWVDSQQTTIEQQVNDFVTQDKVATYDGIIYDQEVKILTNFFKPAYENGTLNFNRSKRQMWADELVTQNGTTYKDVVINLNEQNLISSYSFKTGDNYELEATIEYGNVEHIAIEEENSHEFVPKYDEVNNKFVQNDMTYSLGYEMFGTLGLNNVCFVDLSKLQNFDLEKDLKIKLILPTASEELNRWFYLDTIVVDGNIFDASTKEGVDFGTTTTLKNDTAIYEIKPSDYSITANSKISFITNTSAGYQGISTISGCKLEMYQE